MFFCSYVEILGRTQNSQNLQNLQTFLLSTEFKQNYTEKQVASLLRLRDDLFLAISTYNP